MCVPFLSFPFSFSPSFPPLTHTLIPPPLSPSLPPSPPSPSQDRKSDDNHNSFSVETLQDALIVLFEECRGSSFKKEKTVEDFVKAGTVQLTFRHTNCSLLLSTIYCHSFLIRGIYVYYMYLLLVTYTIIIVPLSISLSLYPSLSLFSSPSLSLRLPPLSLPLSSQLSLSLNISGN